jgi:hypothetical protein
MSVRSSATSAVAVDPFSVLDCHSPFGRLRTPARRVAGEAHAHVHLAELVEHAHRVVIGDAARGRVVDMHQQARLAQVELGKNRVDRSLRGGREQDQRRARIGRPIGDLGARRRAQLDPSARRRRKSVPN